MDEMDFIQDLILARQDAAIATMREKMDRERAIAPPPTRECDDCGCDIPEGRLRARPMARLCVDCQEETEKMPR